MSHEPQTDAETCDVAVVGGGPAGLALATALKRRGVDRVVVLERDREAGGVPRHCGHYPFGVHEFGRLLRGPDYARRHATVAEAAGAEIRCGVTVAQIHEGGRLSLSSDRGVSVLTARRVALCTGAREASRAQRFIGGERQLGVIPTGALQAFVYLEGLTPFRHPVIVGTELVSFSALLTCRHAGIRPVAMIEESDQVTARCFLQALPLAMGAPIHFGAQVGKVLGRDRVEGVEIVENGGRTREIEADGVILTGCFRPETALLRSGHLEIDPATGGPVIDQYGRASDPAYFCAGNLLRPIETSTWSAREGRETALRIADDLARDAAPGPLTPIRVAHEALRFALPQRLSGDDAPGAMAQMQFRLARPARGRLTASVEGREIWSAAIDSRPERRLLAPLAPLLRHRGAPAIEISVREDNR